jgi:hypothetical protein
MKTLHKYIIVQILHLNCIEMMKKVTKKIYDIKKLHIIHIYEFYTTSH